MGSGELIHIEVAYALKERACVLALDVPQGTTLSEAIDRSGIVKQFPDIDLSSHRVGVFSQPRNLSDVLKEGDRVEIYRPLQLDPKEARRRRAEKE